MNCLKRIRKKLGVLFGKYKVINLLYKFFKELFLNGPTNAFKKVYRKVFYKKKLKDTRMYHEMFPNNLVLEEQRRADIQMMPLISILVPLYNTKSEFLLDMIQSVIAQTYTNWELILVDASDKSLEMQIKKYKDDRIHYFRLTKNLGIVGNTNIAYKNANGSYIGLLDHDDMLNVQCLYKVVERINLNHADFIYTDEITFKSNPAKDCYQPNLKPDFSPDTLRSYNYICHFSCFKKSLLTVDEELLDKEMEGSQDYDLILRLTERASVIAHIDTPLYFWRAHELSVASSYEAKPYVIDAAKRALQRHLERVEIEGIVEDAIIPTTYKINYKILKEPLVSIIIPNCDHKADLKKCIDSIKQLTTYLNYEILIIENNSEDQETFLYYNSVKCDNIRIINYSYKFNYSMINNFAVEYTKGEYLIFLNNDIEIISENWIQEMLMFGQRSDVGCVGVRLLYPDNTIQHAGVVIGIGGVAGHAHKYLPKDDYGFMSRLQIAQNMSAVTAACMLIKKEIFKAVNGFDENFAIAFNDVDFCLRVQRFGKLCVYTPFAELYHYESKSRGQEDSAEKIKRFNSEVALFEKKWGLWNNDPYYNRFLKLTSEQFEID